MTELINTNPPEAANAAALAEQAYEIALAYEIDSAGMYTAAGDELRSIATRKKEIDELRLSLTRPLDESKKRIMDLFRAPVSRLEEAEGLLRKGMLTWKQKEDARIAAERAEAERKAREERERLAAEAAEAARRAAELEAAGDAEAAAEAAAEAEAAQIEAELAEVAPVAPPVVPTAKADGISSRVTWKAEVTDFAALVIAAGKAAEAGDQTMLAYLTANTTALGQVAKALKGQARIAGVRIYSEESLAVRGR